MDANEYYEMREEQIINEESWDEDTKTEELHQLRQECQQYAEEEVARDAEADGYRRYL